MILQQTDSITAQTYSLDGETEEQPVFHRPTTPYQAIQLLPYNATPSQKDDIVRKYFQPVIVKPSQRPDTLYLPGLKGEGRIDFEKLPSYKDGFFSGNKYLNPNLKVTFTGVPGDPIPYSLRSDVFVTSTLLMSFFVVMYIFARSMHVLKMQLKNFFYVRDRKQIFTLKSDSEMKNQAFIVLLACFLLTILFFDYTEERMTSVFNQVSPYKLLAIDMGILLFYFISKYIYYSIVNWTFFSNQKRSQWINAYNFIILAKAVCLLAVVLLVVYFSLDIQATIIATLSIIGISEILMIFKAKQIFFTYKFGLLHLFLYFCTLELVPLFFLWEILVSANKYLIAYL